MRGTKRKNPKPPVVAPTLSLLPGTASPGDGRLEVVIRDDVPAYLIELEAAIAAKALGIINPLLATELTDYVVALRKEYHANAARRLRHGSPLPDSVDIVLSCRTALEEMIPPPPAPIPLSTLVSFSRAIATLGESNYTVYNLRPMGDAAADAAAARTLLDAPDSELTKYVQWGETAAAILRERGTTGRAKETPRPDAAELKAAAKVLAAARTEKPGPRGPRHTLDPRLPKTAPEIYRKRARRPELGGKKENVVQFVQRVYASWIDILTRADLRILDETADNAVENWISSGKRLPQGLLLTESELAGGGQTVVRGASKLREGLPAPHK
jgi:hypothetical protein